MAEQSSENTRTVLDPLQARTLPDSFILNARLLTEWRKMQGIPSVELDGVVHHVAPYEFLRKDGWDFLVVRTATDTAVYKLVYQQTLGRATYDAHRVA